MAQLTAAQPLVYRAGNHLITLSITGAASAPAYRVEVLTGGGVSMPVAELTRSFPDEQLARLVARVITFAFLRGGDVEYARLAVVALLDGQAVLQTAGVHGSRNRETLRGLRAGFAVAVA